MKTWVKIAIPLALAGAFVGLSVFVDFWVAVIVFAVIAGVIVVYATERWLSYPRNFDRVRAWFFKDES